MSFPAGSNVKSSPGSWTNTQAILVDANNEVILLDGDVVVDEGANGNESISWQWRLADDDQGANAADVVGQTAQTTTTLESQVGSYIGVNVLLDHGTDSATASSAWSFVGVAYDIGDTLITSPGSWSDLGAILTDGGETDGTGVPDLDGNNDVVVGAGATGSEEILYQWYRADDDLGTNAASIAGATSRTYILQVADADKYVACGVKVNNGGAESVEAASNYVGPVLNEALTPPVVSSPANQGNTNYAENGTGNVFTAMATGNPPPTWSVSGADAALFAIGSSTGVLTWQASPNYEAPLDANGDNVYEITLTATNSQGSDLVNHTITVTDVDDVAPVISYPTPSLQVQYPSGGTDIVFTAQASTAFKTFSLTGTDAALFTIGSSSGIVRFASTPDYASPADGNGDNVYEFSVAVTNATGSDLEAVSVRVLGGDDDGDTTDDITFSVPRDLAADIVTYVVNNYGYLAN